MVDEEMLEEDVLEVNGTLLEEAVLEEEMYKEELEEVSDPSTFSFKEFYPVNPPFGFIGIQVDEELGKSLYITFEPTLEEDEQNTLEAIREVMVNSTDIPLETLKDASLMDSFLREKLDKVFQRFRKKVPTESKEKFIYYLMRDFLGYGKIDLLMRDPNIEDVSCNGVGTPIYVWHRKHESLPTNIVYDSPEELNFIVTRIVYKTGNQISIAHPILEGTLPEGYRVHVTLDEISKRGDTFTIRKYPAYPIFAMTSSSYSALSETSGATVSYRSLKPSFTR